MKNKNNSPLDIVSAYFKEDGICYSQVVVEGKGNEIEAILRLIDKISVKECIVTIDAIGIQKEIIKKIGKKMDYFCLQVKGNQKTLKEDIEDYFADKGFRKKLKKEGMYSRKTEKVLHNEYSRGSGRICKIGKRTLNKNAARNLNILRKLAISILE